jgi:hypothetical protein
MFNRFRTNDEVDRLSRPRKNRRNKYAYSACA